MKFLLALAGGGVLIPMVAATVRFYWHRHLDTRNRRTSQGDSAR